MPALRVVLGDQLSPSLSALSDSEREDDTVLMMEVREEGEYVPHHPKKIIFLLSAMRHFADALARDGHSVAYVRLDMGALVQDAAEPISRQLTPPFEQEWAFALERLDGSLRVVLSSSSTAFNHTATGGEAADALADVEAPTP